MSRHSVIARGAPSADLLPWVRHALTRGRPRLSSVLRAGRCSDCGRPVLRGLDDETCAQLVAVEPRALGPLGEALALMGREWCRTYWLTTGDGKARLVPRDQWSIAGDPAGGTRWPVVARHVCGQVLPGDGRDWRPPPRPRVTDEPPF